MKLPATRLETDGLVVDTLRATRRTLRIACVTETYPPEINGVSGTVARVVEGLHQRHHDLQLVRPRQLAHQLAEAHPRFHEVLMRGLPVPRYPNLRMGVPSKRALVRLWSHHRPDVVHIATEGPLGWSALQAARHLKLPVCSDFRTNFHAYSQHYGVGWLHRPIMAYLRKFHNQTGCTMVPTAALRRDLLAAGFQRIVVVPRGVDAHRFNPAFRSETLRASWGAAPDDLVVGHVGRVAAEKNLQTLCDAFDAIVRARPRARLVVVGDGPQRAELQARCPHAVFAGQRMGEDLAAHYASMDLFLFPSQTETFGNVTPEAMASGLPVLAFDHAAASQLIRHRHSGVLVPIGAGDVEAFVHEAVALALDDPGRRLMAQAAWAAAQDLGWDSVLVRFEAVLLHVMQQADAHVIAPVGRQDGLLGSFDTLDSNHIV